MADMVIQISQPFKLFHDIDGMPLEDGYIYIGESGLDPISNPITVYSDVGLTIPIVQPIRTIGGYPVVSGTPIQIYAALGYYSITVLNKRGTLIYTDLVVEYDSIASGFTFSSLQAAADTDLTGTNFVRTSSFYDWTPPDIPKGGAGYYADNTTGTPQTLYSDNSGFYDKNGNGFSIYEGDGDLNYYQFGADGAGDAAKDTAAKDAALAYFQAKGGGALYIPPGNYEITTPWTILFDNFHIYGAGYETFILNTLNVVSDWDPAPFLFGTYGGYGTPQSCLNETSYDLDDTTAGSNVVTLTTAGDASNFVVGDLVFLWDQHIEDGYEQYMFVNEIVAISGADITLKYGLANAMTVDGSNQPQLARQTGSGNGINSEVGHCVRNSSIKNMRIENSSSSEGQIIHCSAFQCTFENLWLKGSIGMGCNPFAYNTLININVQAYHSLLEISHFSHNNTLSHIQAARIGNETSNTKGVEFNENGQENVLTNFSINVYGYVGAPTSAALGILQRKTTVANGVVTGSPAYAIGLSAVANESSVSGVKVDSPTAGGIIVNGCSDVVLKGNTLLGTTTGNYGIFLASGSQGCSVSDNVIGIEGARTAYDIIQDNNGAQTTNKFRNNQTVHSLPEYINGNFIGHTGTLTETTIATYTLPAGSPTRNLHVPIKLCGNINGTNGTKTLRLKINGATASTLIVLAATTGAWFIESEYTQNNSLAIQSLTTKMITSDATTPLTSINASTATNTATTDIVLTFTIELANVADTVITRLIEFKPASDQFQY